MNDGELVRPDEPHSVSDDEAMVSMARFYADLDKWIFRMGLNLRPNAASDFAEDDTAWPPFPCSQVAWQSLVTAVDHLDLIRTTVLAGHTFPIAIYTPVRGALVGVSLALWVMTPDTSAERQARSLIAANERYTRIREWAQECGHTEALDQTEPFRQQVLMLLDDRGIGQRLLKTTRAVAEAAPYCFPNEPLWASRALSLWRTSSGDAHALGWAILTRRYNTGDSDGVTSARQSAGDLVETAAAFNICARMAQVAWRLWEQRQA